MSDVLQVNASPETPVVAESLPAELPDDTDLINAIISSGGDVELAAEKANTTKEHLLARYPTLNKDILASGIRTAIQIQTFQLFTDLKVVVLHTLDELSATQRSKFMLELLPQLSGLVAPPVQGAGSTPTSVFNIINQMNTETQNAEDSLIKRISAVTNTRAEDIIHQEPDTSGTNGAVV